MDRLPKRRCPGSSVCPNLLESGQRYCAQCARVREVRRGDRVSRGYGAHHVALRKHYEARFETGESFTCVKCGKQITPGMPWDLGHTPDRKSYTGPEHEACNRSDGGKRGRAASKPAR